MTGRIPLALAAVLVLIVAGSASAVASDSDAPLQTGSPGAAAAPALQAPAVVRGRILCKGDPVHEVAVVVDGHQGQTARDGRFEIRAAFTTTPTRVFVTWEANIRVADAPGSPTAPMTVMNEGHKARNASVDRRPTVTGDVADFRDFEMPGDDCVLWNLGVEALRHYYSQTHALPPARGLRVKRWEAVYMSAGAAPHTFYDYIVAPTDVARDTHNRDIFFHEFGHSIRQVADGSQTHWNSDNVAYIYARLHNGDEVTDKGFAFNEGWAHYWETAVLGGSHSVAARFRGHEMEFLDWNEVLVGEYLRRLSLGVGPATMVRVLTENPGSIHTIYQFEQRYCALSGVPTSPSNCKNGAPVRARPSTCPPGYHDDGATCRLENIKPKPSYGRGVGTPPKSCGAGQEYDAGLCYPVCPAGYHGVGPVCWQDCPRGYKDDGATCRRDASIISANNSACPWYDKCGLGRSSRGCSVCPEGYKNDGCTCRRDAHIFGKDSRGRGVGKPPTSCPAGQEYDAGLCYAACRAGYHGVGPVCWGTCPDGTADHGATCYQEPNIFSDDGV